MGTKAFARTLAAVASATTLVLGAAPAWAANQSKPGHGGGGGGSAAGTGVDVIPASASCSPAAHSGKVQLAPVAVAPTV